MPMQRTGRSTARRSRACSARRGSASHSATVRRLPARQGEAGLSQSAVAGRRECPVGAHRVVGRILTMRARHGAVAEEQGSNNLADDGGAWDEDRTPRPLQVAESTYRIACGTRADQKPLTVQVHAAEARLRTEALCGHAGISLHAALRCEADDRQEGWNDAPLLHAHGGGPLARGAKGCRAGGAEGEDQWREGTTHLVMSSTELVQQPAALVPRRRMPRAN